MLNAVCGGLILLGVLAFYSARSQLERGLPPPPALADRYKQRAASYASGDPSAVNRSFDSHYPVSFLGRLLRSSQLADVVEHTYRNICNSRYGWRVNKCFHYQDLVGIQISWTLKTQRRLDGEPELAEGTDTEIWTNEKNAKLVDVKRQRFWCTDPVLADAF